MRGLSLTQPWATLVAVGAKEVETRSWSTKYRGPVAIHASANFPVACRTLCFNRYYADALQAAGYSLTCRSYREVSLPCGVILATANLVEVYQTEQIAHQLGANERAFGDYAPGRYAWFLERVIRLKKPIPYKGALGLWNVPDQVREQIATAIRAA